MTSVTGEVRLKGIPVCRGVALGKPFFFGRSYVDMGALTITESQVAGEKARYRKALARCKGDIERLREQLKRESLHEGAAILEAHLQLLDDPLIGEEIERLIEERRLAAESAFQGAISEYQHYFEKLSDSFFRERFKDIQDIMRRVLGHLRHMVRVSVADVPHGSVVFADELSAYEAAEADPHRVLAFVTEAGGMTTHAAILAKAKGIPYVARVAFNSYPPAVDEIVIVDGRTGEVIVAPHADTIVIYRHVKEQIECHASRLEQAAEAPTTTCDGLAVRLFGNVEAVEEVALLHQYGGAGVGLLRSENLFFAHTTPPSEEEQYLHYRTFVEQMKGLPLVIRTFDFGGDKSFSPLGGDVGVPVIARAFRYLLQEQKIFKRQLRAILRASVSGAVSILFPMVTSVSEIREAKRLLAEVVVELAEEGVPYLCAPRLGCMVEVPAAVVIADLLAKECDFLSIGTNDLIQYSMAVDRCQQTLSALQLLCHPGLLRMIKAVIKEGEGQGIPVAICGEIASDPRFTSLLLGLGAQELSVACRYIPLVKNAIRTASVEGAAWLAAKALTLETSAEVQELLVSAYRKTAPEDCFYNY